MSSIKVLVLVVQLLFVTTAYLSTNCVIHAFSVGPVVSQSCTRSSTKRRSTAASTVVTALAVLPTNQKPQQHHQVFKMITSAVITANTFLIPVVQAIVEQDDNYEYGAVDAPIGIAVGGGILAILTALLPVALKGGEEAFEEIKDRDVDTFGKRNTDLLTKKKK